MLVAAVLAGRKHELVPVGGLYDERHCSCRISSLPPAEHLSKRQAPKNGTKKEKEKEKVKCLPCLLRCM